MTRASIVFVVLSSLVVACVETDDPTGPAPTPPGDEGELTSAVATEVGQEAPVGDGWASTHTRASANRALAGGLASSARHESAGSGLTSCGPIELV